MESKYEALEYLLKHSSERGLFPEEREQLRYVLGRIIRLESVCDAAEALCNALLETEEQVLVDSVSNALDALHTRVGKCTL